MKNHNSSPIFIHSLFRSGSTYIFNVFRRSKNGYWCYQEPLNEKLLIKASQPNGFKTRVSGIQELLRHPELDKAYTYEFHVVADEVTKLFREDFSYKHFFYNPGDNLNEISNYFSALIHGAKGRPVLQCCRTTGRVTGLKSAFGGTHLFLWRNPWDQWWSYKSDNYFSSRNLLIADANNLPAFLQSIKNELQIPAFTNTPPKVKQAYFTNRQLDSSGSYALFYALWCHAMLEAKHNCDLALSIDELSISNSGREETIEKLQQLGITGIDISDCLVPRARYGESDLAFFARIENSIHDLLVTNGYDSDKTQELIELADKRRQTVADTSHPDNSAVRDAMRAREYSLRTENRLSEMQSMLFNTRAQAQNAEARAKQAESKIK
jgi:hypothetical protein